MNKEQFDGIIKNNLVVIYGDDTFGYVLSKTYDNYYSREAFNKFIAEMQIEKHMPYFESYYAGKGSELKEQTGKYGITPPKMASVASSSRFCYLALRNGVSGLGGSGQVDFEHECRIKGISGIAPQLDAYIPNENIFVEAKCHEIFDLHKVVLSTKYWEYIHGEDNDFGMSVLDKPDTDTFDIPISVFGISQSNTMFDIKQFLCHLLGIASQKHYSDEAQLVYLFFKPMVEDEKCKKEIDEVFFSLQQEITSIFSNEYIRRFTTKHNIKLLAIAEYAKIMEQLTTQNTITLVSI